MRKIFAWCSLLTGFLCACSTAPTISSVEPAWYQRRAVVPVQHIDGYGSGASVSEARAAALADLAQQLKARVQSSVQSQQTQVSSAGRESVSSWAQIQTKMSSDLVLTDYALQKSEQQGERHFVWVRYDNRDLAARIQAAPPRCTNTSVSPWSALPVSELLRGCAWQLIRRNGAWRLSVKEGANDRQWAVHAGDIEQFFFVDLRNGRTAPIVDWVATPALTASALNSDLKEGSRYFFRVAHSEAAIEQDRKEFFFQINQLGQVATLPIKNSGTEPVFFPKPKEYDGLVAELNFDEKIVSTDWVVMAACPTSTNLSAHRAVSNEVQLNDESRYTFGRLLADLQVCEVNARLLRVIPKP